MNLLSSILAILLAYIAYGLEIAESMSYGCNVDNCQSCSGPEFCGLCDINFILMVNSDFMPYCAEVSCDIENCAQCYQDNMCQKCNENFAVNSDGACSPASSEPIQCSSNCLVCSSTTECTLCGYGFNLQDGVCAPNNGALVPYCWAYFTGFMCQVCKQNYLVNPAYQCSPKGSYTCTVSNCQQCSDNNVCSLCSYGFQLNAGACESLACDVVNCAECEDNSEGVSVCSACKPSYYLNQDDNLCVPQYPGCNIANCVTCAETAETCSLCSVGFMPSASGSMCMLLTGSSVSQLNTSSIFYYPVRNCAKYGEMIPGTSILYIGCQVCEGTFINNGGYCVANLTSNYTCNIDNCVYCTQNNYCGKCADGYIVFMGSAQKCVPMYSPYQYCKLTGLFSPSCAICNDGYVTNSEGECVRYWSSSKCSIEGCSYCLTQGQCTSCRSGYELDGTNCSPICSVDNCYTCKNATNCQTCTNGYSLVDNACTLTNDTTKDDCTTYNAQCTSCNVEECTACGTGYILYGSKCCEAPAQDVYGCEVYESPCSNICIQCQIGFNIVTIPFLNFSTQCLNFYCPLENCAYCYNSPSNCIVCMENYTVASNGSCVLYNTEESYCGLENCEVCNSDGTCNTCLSGYYLYEGACVCQFQNCIKCMANAYCSICAYPMVATGFNTRGCLPEVVPATYCQVDNCEECQNNWYCAVCANGFYLSSNGSCIQNICDKSTNCELCSPNSTQCFLCKENYYQTQTYSKQCNAVPTEYACLVDGCSLCQTSTTCSKCYSAFYLADGSCLRYTCVDNCLMCYANNTCSICLNGFYRSMVSNKIQCLPIQTSSVNCSTIDQCLHCESDEGTIKCMYCEPGFELSESQSSCVPQDCDVQYCQVCMPSVQNVCLECMQGYFINPYYRCEPFNPQLATSTCDVYNCQFCGTDNKCSNCLLGWTISSQGLCVSQKYCNVANCAYCTSPELCYSCDKNYLFTSTNVCSPNCTVPNCQVCSTFSACSSCEGDLVPSDGECKCRETFISTGGTTCGCPTNFTASENVCYNCTNVGNCSICSSANKCGTCLDETFKIVDGQCVCPDDTFIFSDNTCTCPNNTKLYENTCIQCDVVNCQACDSEDSCKQCINNLTLISTSECDCPETFELSDDEYCVCADKDAKTNVAKTMCYACDIDDCDFCSANGVCEQCQTNFTLADSNKKCQCVTGQTPFNGYCYTCNSTIVPYCNSCSANNFCAACPPTFIIDNGTCVCATGFRLYEGSCIQCNISNCDQCATANSCSQCLTGYYGLSTSTCILCNIQNCSSCSSPNFCSSCKGGLVINSQGNLCVTCEVDQCQTCSANNVCASCASGFVFGIDNRACVSCSLAGCATCSANNVCAKCLTGYTLSSGVCSLCSYPCATCNDNGGCLTCQSPYATNAFTNGSCYTCQTPNCQACSSNNLAVCTQCTSLYQVNSSNLCEYKCLDSNCLNCQFSQICTQCSPGFSPDGSTGCNQCEGSPACIECSSTDLSTCYQCGDGYYLQEGTCNTCPYTYCKTCTKTGCLTFKSSTPLTPLVVNNVVYPATCDPNCQVCSSSNPNTCSTCRKGYSLKNGICIPCQGNCLTCSNTDSSQCLTCFSNANLNTNNSCIVCQGNCLTCQASAPTTCTSCPNGFFLSNSTCIQGCPNLCKTCSSSTFCTECESGFAATSNGTCLPCLSSCRKCSGSAQGVCLDCGTGFYLTNDNTCEICPGNCTSCNYAGCIQCSDGFTLTASFQCAPTCEPPCSICSTTDATVCFDCILGYTFNSATGVCDPSPFCEDGVCYFCPFGQILSDNQCLSCTNSSNCARCDPSSLSTCTSCLNGMFLNTANNTCQSCPSACATCSSSTNCLTCAFGYTAVEQVVPSSVSCQACLSPCQTCMSTPTTCTSCDTGFVLNGWNCLSTYNFGFLTELNTNFTTFYQNYNAFLLAIANAFGTTNVGIIAMSALKNGSVVAGGNITVTDSNSQSGYSNLNSVLGNGTSIAGMSVISSSVTVNGGQAPSTSSGVNLALILGICIPVGVILIGILVYFLCIRKKSPYPPVQYSNNNGGPNTSVRQTFELTRQKSQL